MESRIAPRIKPVWLIYLAIALAGGMKFIMRSVELPDASTATVEGQTTVFRPVWWSTILASTGASR